MVAAAYVIVAVGTALLVGRSLGREIFPSTGAHQFQLRLRAPAGTMFEATERLTLDILQEIKAALGPDSVDITLGYVGVQPSSYPINTIFLDWRIARSRGPDCWKKDATTDLARLE
jgi:multidrug efflux pump subunit AcrB